MIGHIGVDESGKGDYFGPLVIAACYVGAEHLAELDGVKDSKKLTDENSIKLAMRIREVCPHAIVAIGPEKYNELYEKFNNLNSLLAWGHAQAIENALKEHPSPFAISDEFSKGGHLVRQQLAKKGINIELKSAVRAESDIAVAAASILARAEFLRRLSALSSQFEMKLPKGATSVVDPGRRFVACHGASALRNVAKLHFKTTQQVLAH